jgi:hypothetical protein
MFDAKCIFDEILWLFAGASVKARELNEQDISGVRRYVTKSDIRTSFHDLVSPIASMLPLTVERH